MEPNKIEKFITRTYSNKQCYPQHFDITNSSIYWQKITILIVQMIWIIKNDNKTIFADISSQLVLYHLVISKLVSFHLVICKLVWSHLVSRVT